MATAQIWTRKTSMRWWQAMTTFGGIVYTGPFMDSRSDALARAIQEAFGRLGADEVTFEDKDFQR